MKLTFLLMCGFVLSLSAAVRAQDQVVTLKVEGMPFTKVISELKRQTQLDFFYSFNEIDVNRTVSLDVKDLKIDEVLRQMLGSKFTWEYIDRMVIIKPVMSNEPEKKSVRVKGFVFDAGKQPMPGVTVKVVGIPLGTATNEKGWFAIELPLQKGALEFSFVGFKKKVIEFSEKIVKDTLQITLEEDVQALDETVVVAYGSTTRRKTTGAISTVKAEEMRGIPSTSIENLLQGRVAGMDVVNMSGAPGGGGTAITIRGYNSLDVEQGRRFSNPLWVVDGVPLNSFTSPITGTNLLADVNPDMIESVQVLKDASAASIYGSRAANGVIIVTTKKGNRSQKATFTVNASQTWSILPELPTVTTGRAERLFRLDAVRKTFYGYLDPETNSYKYPTTIREMYENQSQNASCDGNFVPKVYGTTNGSVYQDSLNSFFNNSTNYFPIYWVKGKVTNANIQTYGGAERMTYGIGLGYYNESGIFRGTGYNRIDLNSSLNVIPVEHLNVDLRLNATLSNRKRGVKIDGLGVAPSVETVPGDPYKLQSILPGEGSIAWNSVLDAYKGTKEKNRGIRLRSNFKVGYDIIEGLNISTSLAADYSIERRNYFQPSYLSDDGFSISMGETGINLMALNENLLSFDRTIKEKHDINFVAGFSYQYDQMEYNGGSAQNAPSDKIHYAPLGLPDLGELSSGDYSKMIAFQRYRSDMEEKVLMSYFARLEYGYASKYLLSFSIRRDGSSTFGEDKRWGTFPSVAAAWTFSEEAFVKDNLGWLSFGKIRASWGRSGMHFSNPYLALGVMQVGSAPYLGNSTIEPIWDDGLYNQDLSWEETDQYDFGLDLDFFEHRLSVTLDYYYRYTDKLLAAIALPANGLYTGYKSQWRNAGAISNEGIELMVKYDIFREPDLYWKISVNGARNWNRFEKSYDKKDFNGRVIGKPLNGIYAYKTDGYVNYQYEVPQYYDQQGALYYMTESTYSKGSFFKPGDYNFIDINGDTYINNKDGVYMGSALPEISGGIVNELRWKNFDLNMLCAYSLGRHIMNRIIKRTFNPNAECKALVYDLKNTSFWEQPGDNSDYPMWQYTRGYMDGIVDRDVEKVNYLKLKTLTVGYSLPEKWGKKVGMNELRFFVSGENLLTWTNYSGSDPETVDIRTGIDSQESYPLARKYTIGLTLKF